MLDCNAIDEKIKELKNRPSFMTVKKYCMHEELCAYDSPSDSIVTHKTGKCTISDLKCCEKNCPMFKWGEIMTLEETNNLFIEKRKQGYRYIYDRLNNCLNELSDVIIQVNAMMTEYANVEENLCPTFDKFNFLFIS